MTQLAASAREDGTRRATHQAVRERWVIKGVLTLISPAHFGAGEVGDYTDMPVLLDESDRAPLLTGASIAGALRNYLREVERGDGAPLPFRPQSGEDADQIFERRKVVEQGLATTLLFGGYRGDDDGVQSSLIVYDAPGTANGYELRDGVAIDRRTRSAAEDKKFDIELLAAGSTFNLRFELLGRTPRRPPDASDDWDMESAYAQERQRLLSALSVALNGLAGGAITLGARKRRGYGLCRVDSWQVQHYDLTQREHLLAWLVSERDQADEPWYAPVPQVQTTSIDTALGDAIELLPDRRRRVELRARFAIDGSLLIRSGFGSADIGPDMAHLHSLRPDHRSVPIVPGTSWAGILRHRSQQIVNTLGTDKNKAQSLIEGMFGPAAIKQDERHRASRLTVAESLVEGGRSLVQSRVKIDRFTGGAHEEALFSEAPLLSNHDAYVELMVSLRPPPPSDPFDEEPTEPAGAEVGLLLLLLKDLWTGDLRIGGESGVGRGKLRGLEATLTLGTDRAWSFERQGDQGLTIGGDPAALESFVSDLQKELRP